MSAKTSYGRVLETAAFDLTSLQPVSATLGWSCPANIAIIKYWGKRAVQMPMNPSLSMTLQEARTLTRMNFKFDPEQKHGKLRFRFEGRALPAFELRIRNYIKTVEPFMPVLVHSTLEIDSENTFPHSSGIASSASAMGALAMCLVQMEEIITGQQDPALLRRKASFIARLGSGSASRSLFPNFSLWGISPTWKGSSDEYAVPLTGFHPNFMNMRDSILIVESGQKKVSSSTGHSLMETHPFSMSRFSQARENLAILKVALMEGDWDALSKFCENESVIMDRMGEGPVML